MAKESSRTTTGELQKIVESRGQKTLKNCQTAPTSPHVVWEGFKKKKSPSSYKNKLQDIQLSDTAGTSNGTGFYGQMKQKTLAFYQQTLKMGLVNTGIKKYLMCTIKYTAVFLMFWVYISAGGPGHLV